MVKLTDYIANPCITIKYQEVFEQLLSVLPELEQNRRVFKLCQNKIGSLLSDCYSFETNSIDEQAFNYFEE